MADRAPFRPKICPPVGKSGPGTIVFNSLSSNSGFSINASVALITSPRLCGGILVAIPTAIPFAPLTSRLGKRAGKTTGSRSELS